MVKHRLPESQCPDCGAKISAASTVEENDIAHPSEGDVAFCLYCGCLAAYTGEFKLRPLTSAELSDIMKDAEVANQILAMRRAFHAANSQR